jgi:hypothetical protein
MIKTKEAVKAMSAKQNRVVGLDVGTSRIVTARQADKDIRFESQLNAFVNIPYSKMTEVALEREKIPHTRRGTEIVIQGNESEKFADLMNTEIRRTMTKGLLDAKEPESLSMMRQLLSAILNESGAEKSKVCFTVPAAPLGAEELLTYHEATLRQIITDLGHQASSINEGLAIIYSELESSNYTGLGISCGGGLCNVCLAYLSAPVVSFSIAKAGDYIDANAASMTGELANRVRLAKEQSFHFNGTFSDKLQQVINVYYDDMIRSLVSALKEAFSRSKVPKFGRPVPLVLSGGTALPPGFRDRFENLIREQELPISIAEVRLAQDPLHSTAKGALVSALSEG